MKGMVPYEIKNHTHRSKKQNDNLKKSKDFRDGNIGSEINNSSENFVLDRESMNFARP